MFIMICDCWSIESFQNWRREKWDVSRKEGRRRFYSYLARIPKWNSVNSFANFSIFSFGGRIVVRKCQLPAFKLILERARIEDKYLLSEPRACNDADASLLEQERTVISVRNKTFLASFFDELFWKFDIWESVHGALNWRYRGFFLSKSHDFVDFHEIKVKKT